MQTGTEGCFVLNEPVVIYSPDKVDDLLDLVEQFCTDKIDRLEFRKRFVVEFAGRLWGEPLDTITLAIEGASYDFNPDGHPSLEQLQDRLTAIAGVVEAVQMKRTPETRRFFKRLFSSGNTQETNRQDPEVR